MANFRAVISALTISAAVLFPVHEVWGQSGTTGSGTPQTPLSDGAGGTLNTNPADIISNGNPNATTLPKKTMGGPSSAATARTARRNNQLPPPADGSSEIDSSAAAKLAARPAPVGSSAPATSSGKPGNRAANQKVSAQ